MKSVAKPGGAAKARFTTRSVAIITLALALVLAFLVFFSHRGLYQIYALREEKTRLENENFKLAEENIRLARTIDRLYNDPEMIQDLIRRELTFVKKNEVIIQLTPQERDDTVKAALIPDRPPPTSGPGTEKPRPQRRHR